MPEVKLREIDITGTNEPEYNDFTVLMPCVTSTISKYTEFSTSSDFKTAFGESTATTASKMIEKLLDLGMVVGVLPIASAGATITLTKFEDKGKYDLRFICPGDSTAVTGKQIVDCAANRGDAVGLITVAGTTTTAIATEMSGFTGTSITRFDGTKEDSRQYGAAFAPLFKLNGDETEYPGYFAYLLCFAKHINRFPEWFAMAGSVRGVTPIAINEVGIEFGDSDVALLQKREVSESETAIACNPICNIRPYETIVWGNRTLYPLGTDVNNVKHTSLVASSFLNIRQLCCSIKKTLYRAARKYTFEPNSEVLWINFKSAITPLLEEMKSGNGIDGYKIVKESTNKKAVLKAKIIIVPVEAVEDFYLTVEMSDSIEING